MSQSKSDPGADELIKDAYAYYKAHMFLNVKELLNNMSANDWLVIIKGDADSQISLLHVICTLQPLPPIHFKEIEPPARCKPDEKEEHYYSEYIADFLARENYMRPRMAADFNNLGCAYAWSNQYVEAQETLDRARKYLGRDRDYTIIETNRNRIPSALPLAILDLPYVSLEEKKFEYLTQLRDIAKDPNHAGVIFIA